MQISHVCTVLDHFLRKGPQILITWDASPYGMGATLQVEGEFREYFSIPVSKFLGVVP